MQTIHYRQNKILVDDCDADLAAEGCWRVSVAFGHKFVMHSVPRFEGDSKFRGNTYLHRRIAERIGIPRTRRIGFRDGNDLNLVRSNLFDNGPQRGNGHLGTGVPKAQPSGPPGVRRRARGMHRPANCYEIEVYFPGAAGQGAWLPVGEVDRVPAPAKPSRKPGRPLAPGTAPYGASYWRGRVYGQPDSLPQTFPVRSSFREARADVLAAVPGWPPAQAGSAAA
jgi:hypothetical protein